MALSRFDIGILSNPLKASDFLAGFYYADHPAACDFEAIRKGLIVMVECEGYEWKSRNMFNLKAFRTYSELGGVYPQHFMSTTLFHPGVFSNLLLSASN